MARCRCSGSAQREKETSDGTSGVLRDTRKETCVLSRKSNSGPPRKYGGNSKESAIAMSDLSF